MESGECRMTSTFRRSLTEFRPAEISMRPILLSMILASSLAGCVLPPSVEPDIERARQSADARGALDPHPYEAITHLPFIGGNAVRLLENGPATYAAMTEMIEAGRHRIDMESYAFEGDEAVKFADLLLAKRAQGLEVNLIYDAWGSDDTAAALFKRLREGGVKVLEYHRSCRTIRCASTAATTASCSSWTGRAGSRAA